jgi:hypothetical protein
MSTAGVGIDVGLYSVVIDIKAGDVEKHKYASVASRDISFKGDESTVLGPIS